MFLALAALAAAVWLWGLGGADRLAFRAAQAQREVQEAMAFALRGLRAGEAGALLTLWGLCFGYGFLHAAGPGHGKFVIGAMGLGRRIPAGRLVALALASSMAQAVTAVALVGAGVLLLGWTQDRMQLFADHGLTILSAFLIGGVGLWLLWRGGRGLHRLAAPSHRAAHRASGGSHHHHGPHVCASCGHAHGPSAEQVMRATNWKEALAVVGAVAARPCTGALFLLVLTWRMGIFAAGIGGAFAMALGTATVTVAIAAGAAAIREGAFLHVVRGPGAARVLGVAEMLAGLLVLAIAVALLRQAV
ncbi:nickel/cobalt transporter [Rubellimicrobium sp. CFH 75288]|uniref:nickel/cobalt transporter n=1 Tax=Rubellimicrobium sp. CFH 75288 TaxID=2697034 RepID=UPI00352B4454